MEYKEFMKMLDDKNVDVEEVVWYKHEQPVSGISEPPAMMVGEATITLRRGDRFIKVQICILKNGDVGKADMLIGNSFMWADHWGACIDCDEELLKIRHADDGKGRLAIPIEWRLNHKKVRSDEVPSARMFRAALCFEA